LAAERAYADSSATATAAVAIVRMFASDGILVSTLQEVIRGRDSVRARLSADTIANRGTVSWFPVRGDVSADGNHGYTYGYFETHLLDGTVRPGKYSAFWQRDVDGAWKVMALRRVGREPSEISYDVPLELRTHALPRYTGDRGDVALLRDSVAATDRAFSDYLAVHGAAEAFETFAAPDAAHISAGVGIVFGPENIAAPLRSRPADDVFSWAPDIVHVATGGDLAYTSGLVEGSFRYFSIWQRQADGSWKFVIEG
jgi:ketosteroid isomerase-like protein